MGKAFEENEFTHNLGLDPENTTSHQIVEFVVAKSGKS